MFKCGFYEKDITPPLGGCIPGYFVKRPAEGVITPLYAKAVAIEANGKCIIIITVDSVQLQKEVYDKAIEIIKDRTNVPEECVMIHATHTHTGGPVGALNLTYPRTTSSPDADYVNMLGRLVGDCGVLAYQRLSQMTAKYAKGELYGVSFVRNYIMKDGSIRTNPGFQHPDVLKPVSQNDPELPVLFFFNEQGTPMGAIINFALHHDCVQGSKYCSDYSGVLAEDLKKKFGNRFVTVFINGTCGNINHMNFDMPEDDFYAIEHYISIGHKMSEKALELYEQAEPFEIDELDAKKEKLMVTRRHIPKEDIEEYKYLLKTIPREGLVFGIDKPDSIEYKRAVAEDILNIAEEPEEQYVNIQAMRFGRCILYAIPGEVYVEFGKLIKNNSPSDINMVAELANGGIYCYVPTEEIFKMTSSYESAITSAPYTADTGEKMARFAVELAKKII